MFGLDARLAMIVFTALAVVAGYYGYGRVETAKQARLIRELDAKAAALQNLQTDLRTFLPFALTTADGEQDITALWDKSILKPQFQSLWNGPYVLDETEHHKHFGRWWLRYGQDDAELSPCTLSSRCFVWLHLSGVPQFMWEKVNNIRDEASGATPEPAGQTISLGRVRATSEEDPRTLIYRTIERKQN